MCAGWRPSPGAHLGRNPCKQSSVTLDGELNSGYHGRHDGQRVFEARSGFHRAQRQPRTCAGITGASVQSTQVADLQVFYGAYRDRTGDLRLAKPALSQLS